MTAELAEAAHDWPDPLTLVVQTRERLKTIPFHERIRCAADGKKVFLLEEPLPAEQYLELVGSADIGLCFYANGESSSLGRNLTLAGKSSGKFSTFIQAGLPVIINHVGGLTTLVEQYRCGIVVSRPTDVSRAASDIRANYSDYASSAQRCFEQEYEEGRYLTPVLDQIIADRL